MREYMRMSFRRIRDSIAAIFSLAVMVASVYSAIIPAQSVTALREEYASTPVGEEKYGKGKISASDFKASAASTKVITLSVKGDSFVFIDTNPDDSTYNFKISQSICSGSITFKNRADYDSGKATIDMDYLSNESAKQNVPSGACRNMGTDDIYAPGPGSYSITVSGIKQAESVVQTASWDNEHNILLKPGDVNCTDLKDEKGSKYFYCDNKNGCDDDKGGNDFIEVTASDRTHGTLYKKQFKAGQGCVVTSQQPLKFDHVTNATIEFAWVDKDTIKKTVDGKTFKLRDGSTTVYADSTDKCATTVTVSGPGATSGKYTQRIKLGTGNFELNGYRYDQSSGNDWCGVKDANKDVKITDEEKVTGAAPRCELKDQIIPADIVAKGNEEMDKWCKDNGFGGLDVTTLTKTGEDAVAGYCDTGAADAGSCGKNTECDAIASQTGSDGKAVGGAACVWKVVNTVVGFLTAGVGLIVTIMIVIGGIQYASAGANPQTTAAAKKRIFNAVFALVAFIFLWAFLSWLIPGGFIE